MVINTEFSLLVFSVILKCFRGKHIVSPEVCKHYDVYSGDSDKHSKEEGEWKVNEEDNDVYLSFLSQD